MAGCGARLLLTDIIIPRGELIHDNFFQEYKNDGIKQKLALTGTLYMLCSIPSSSLYTVIKKRRHPVF